VSEYIPGQKYDIVHQRKGAFSIKVVAESLCHEWLDCVIVGGLADAMLDENTKGVGNPITIRKEFIVKAVLQRGVCRR